MLDKLPPEVLALVARQVSPLPKQTPSTAKQTQLPKKRDLAQLCKVSKQGHTIAMPILYETINIEEDHELRQPNPCFWPIYRSLDGYPHNKSLVKDIHVTRSMHDFGCFHSFDEDAIYQRTLWLRYVRQGGTIGQSVSEFLYLFKDDSLRSFQ
jgi:hypothetical protein